MSKQVSYQPLTDIGLNGLNTQSNPATLDHSWLTKAENVVLRESGRITFRKGLKQKVAPSGTAIGSMIEHNDQGTNKIFASYGTSIYTVDFTSPATAFPSSGADVKHTVANSSGDWQFVNFNDRLHCFHSGVIPQRYDGSLGSGVKWTAHATDPASIGTLFDPSCGMGYYGRIWCGGVAEAKDVVYYSNLLDGDDWTGGDTGLIDLAKEDLSGKFPPSLNLHSFKYFKYNCKPLFIKGALIVLLIKVSQTLKIPPLNSSLTFKSFISSSVTLPSSNISLHFL